MSGLLPGDLVGALLTFADLLALACCLGALGCRLWIVPGDGAMQEVSEIFQRSAAIVGGCLVALAVTSLGLLWWRASTLSGTPPLRSLAVLLSVVTQTHLGHAWAVRAVAIAALAGLWAAARRNTERKIVWWSMLAVAAPLAFSRSASSHAADAGDLTLEEWADWAHLMATSVWAGSVLVVSATVLPKLTRAAQATPRFLAQFARRFSRSSGLALGVVLVAGIYGARLRLGSWSALVETPYGRALAVKLLLVGTAIALGAVNRFLHVRRIECWAREAHAVPSAADDPAASDAPSALRLTGQRLATQFSRTLRLEAAVFVAVLVAVAELLQQVPPGMGMSMARRPPERAFSFGRPAPAERATRAIEIRATDATQFEPSAITVRPGETVRFQVTNAGAISHDFVLGDEKEQREHEQEMRDMEKRPGSGMQDDANGISLAPGEIKFVTWTFPKGPGKVLFACHEPGHYRAGMVGVITIAP